MTANEKKMWVAFAIGWTSTAVLFVAILLDPRLHTAGLFFVVFVCNALATFWVLNRRLK